MFYPILKENNIFYFETETGNKISVEFGDLTNIFEAHFPIYCVDIYRLENNFNRIGHANESEGFKTRDTIISIIKDFFEKFDCALVAFIDTSTDRKGPARNRLFMSWFKEFAGDEFLIEPREIMVSEAESYSFLIIRKSYGNAASLIDAFDKFIALANIPEE